VNKSHPQRNLFKDGIYDTDAYADSSDTERFLSSYQELTSHWLPSESTTASYSWSSLSVTSNTTTQLTDIFISVKTSGKYHASRLELQLKTWWSLASSHTFIFTDVDDEALKKRTNGHVINTKCHPGHTRDALCCKMSFEFDYFVKTTNRWWCHVDDDTYLNVLSLLDLLRQYRHQDDWYIGKTSVVKPMRIKPPGASESVEFVFATGGAGFCISRGLTLKMAPYALGGKFSSMCYNIRLPDDCTIGVIIGHYLKHQLTISSLFWSHLDGLRSIRPENIRQQVTFGYTDKQPNNVVSVPGFNISTDPSRFLSVHCFLFPTLATNCPSGQQST